MKIMRLMLAITSISLLGAACPIRHDTSVLSAVQAGQNTVVFQGGGDGPRRGFLGAEVTEGIMPAAYLMTVTVPKLNCKRTACASFDVVRKDGTLFPLGGIEKGKTSLTFSLEALTGSSKPVVDDLGGPYRVLSELYYEADGAEFKELATGVIYLTVMKPGYVGVACNGPDVAWSQKIGKDCEAQFTTKMRTVLCGKCAAGG